MYKVLSDDIVIHDSSSPDLLFHLVNPVLRIGDSIAGSFEMTVPPSNIGYDLVSRMNSKIIVKKENKIIWTGRVMQESKDYWNSRKFTAEGALAFLNDTIQINKTYTSVNLRTFIASLLDIHNQKAPSDRQFRLGTVTVSDLDDDHLYQTAFGTTWDEFKVNCFDRLGGHIRIRYSGSDTTPILDYLEDYPNTASQEINFGENLLDFTRNWDLTDLKTVIIPRGMPLETERDDGLIDYTTVASVNGGSIYVFNEDAYNTFGRMEEIVDFQDVDDPSVLFALARLYISSQQFDEMQMTVNAVDLHRMAGNPVSFELLDIVRCISKPHGLDRFFPITSIDIPLDSPQNVVYTMGTSATPTISSSTRSDIDNVFRRIRNLPSTTNILGMAKKQAASILNQRTTGYITITERDESSQALVISETKEWDKANKYWMFNMNGLGYTKDGGNTYDVAMTMDGSIVADFVRTGVLEDGYGLNYWNLSTGEFSLAYNTKFRQSTDPSSPTLTIVDVNTLAHDANTMAETASDKADTASNEAVAAATKANTASTQATNASKTASTALTESQKTAGGTNLLIDSNSATTDRYAATAGRSWTHSDGVSDGTIVELDINSRPISGCTRTCMFKFTANQNNKTSGIVYYNGRGIKLIDGQQYTVSCWAFRGGGTASLIFQYGQTKFKASTPSKITGKWKRYSWTFTFNQADVGGSDGARIYFITKATSNTASTVRVSGMKLEIGAKASDWSAAPEDSEYATANTLALAKTYTNAISKKDREYTLNQRTALDESLNQQKILNRLTNNGKAKGIFLKDNQLYINGSYISTGTLDAGIIKAGILSDVKGINLWNLKTGYFTTKNSQLINCNVDGTLTSGVTNKAQFNNGTIRFFTGKKNSLTVDGTMYFEDGGYGAHVTFQKYLVIRGPKLATSTKTNAAGTTCFTGTITIPDMCTNMAMDMSSCKNAHFQLDFINGLLVCAYITSGSGTVRGG